MVSDDVKLADRSFLFATVLVLPSSTGGAREHSAVLWTSAIGLGHLPVLIANARAGLIHPHAVGLHVIYTQPDFSVRSDALVCVIIELSVFFHRERSAEDSTFGDAVFIGRVVAFLHWFHQKTLAVDLDAFEAD